MAESDIVVNTEELKERLNYLESLKTRWRTP